jgi:glycosyltransferase involved in cell wall biosynthesis
VNGCTVVVPCYNEERRLQRSAVQALVDGGCNVLLVDDGSTDGTLALLHSIAAAHPRITVHALASNSGKSEAVRRGLQAALEQGSTLVAYADADFATPPAEVLRLVRASTDGGHPVVIGSRVALMGHRIERSNARHYTGRLFATASSLVLGFPVYDTQCGAKVFADGPILRAALDQPFLGRWSFDVELLGRLAVHGTDGFLEVPLAEWREVGGSKLGLADSVRSTLELVSVRRALRRYRRATRPPTPPR